MSSTVQEMYFETEANMKQAINWLLYNMSSEDYQMDYEILARGLYPEKRYFYLSIWFRETPMMIPYYNENAYLMFEGDLYERR